jgi:lauroyl/myristoyl acyltransferase
MNDSINYFLIRLLTFPMRWMPYAWIHSLGKFLGRIIYHFHTNYRKRTLSNLALAKSLAFDNEEIRNTAKESFENISIISLE